MGLEQVKGTAFTLLKTMGRQALSALYPDDFECYITALELVDSNEKTVDYFVFPINPQSITESENQIVSIKKTAGGISTLSTETFMPTVINLAGDFGRRFKILVGKNVVDFKGYNYSEKLGTEKAVQIFNDTIKTGYGCIKVLEKMIKKSNQLDQNGKPYFLYLYNLNFGKVYLVKCIGQPTFTCNMEKNMIWQYNIQFQTLASLDQIKNKNQNKSNLKLLGYSQIQKSLNVIFGKMSTTLLHENPA